MKKVRLEDICNCSSSNISQKDIIILSGNYPIYGASGKIKNINFYKYDKPYIAIVKDGAGIGRTMLLPAKSSVISTLQYIYPIEDVNIKYLYYAIKNMNLSKYYTGITIPHIYFKDYKKEELNLPKMEEQIEIANTLDKIQNIIDIREKQMEQLDLLVKSQFVEMFENENFEKKTLQEITTKITDGSHNPPNGVAENSRYLMLSSQNIINDKINYDNARFLTKEDFEKENTRTDLKRGDVLLTIVGTVGRTAVITDEKNITLQRSVAVLKPLKEIKSEYLVGALKSDEVVRQLNKGTKGVAQKGIYLNDLKKLIIPIPPMELQNQFAKIVKQINKQKFEIQNSLEELQKLQESLMNKYFG